MEQLHEYLSQRTAQNKVESREEFELLRSRIELLKGKDRHLMRMYLDNGNSIRQLALLASVSEATIARKVSGIVKRLIDERFTVCQRHSDMFTKSEMTIAKEYILLGYSIRKIAAKRHWSYYRTRRAVEKIMKTIKKIAGEKNYVNIQHNKKFSVAG